MRDVDESIEFTAYDPRWPPWFSEDARELQEALGSRLRAIEHFGSTAVPGMASKPVVDILLAPAEWPLTPADRQSLEGLGYEYLGEAGVAGREYFRRRQAHSVNVAAIEYDGALWRDNLALRDYLRARPDVAASYADAKQRAWDGGARTLLAYSEAKGAHVASLIAEARAWRRRDNG